MDPVESLMTTDEVAAYLKVDVVTVRRLVTRGELAAYRIGSEYRFARGDLLDYLERQHVPARSASRRERSSPQQLAVGGTPHGAQERADTSFSRRARRSLQLAADEAQAARRGYLGTEHVLLGLLREDSSVAARCLGEIGITAESVRELIAAVDDWPEREPYAEAASAGAPLMTAHLRQALDAARAQADEWEHSYIGTEHILFGLTRATDGNVALLLEQLGTTPDTVQAEVLQVVRAGTSPA